jgi:hypothetical protein
MNLTSIAARVVLTRLLRGKTFAGANVFDAPVEPLEHVLRAKVPAIAVYVGVRKGKVEGRDLLLPQPGTMEIVIQTYAPPGMEAIPGADEDDPGIRINTTRGGAALLLDVMGRQIVTALMADLGPWANLWRRLVTGYSDYDCQPVLIEVESGVRVPSVEISLVCRTLAEPAFGDPIHGFWADLDTAMRDDAGAAPIADLIKAQIEGPADMPSWHKTLASMGWSLAALQASGLGPADATALDDGEEPAEGDEDGGTVDPATIEISTFGDDPSPLEGPPA